MKIPDLVTVGHGVIRAIGVKGPNDSQGDRVCLIALIFSVMADDLFFNTAWIDQSFALEAQHVIPDADLAALIDIFCFERPVKREAFHAVFSPVRPFFKIVQAGIDPGRCRDGQADRIGNPFIFLGAVIEDLVFQERIAERRVLVKDHVGHADAF